MPNKNFFPGGHDKDNLSVQIRQRFRELYEIVQILAYSEYQLTITTDQALKELKKQEVANLKRERDRVSDELTKLVIRKQLKEIRETLDYWENQVPIGEDTALKKVQEKAVANLKRARDRLVDELRHINRKRRDK